MRNLLLGLGILISISFFNVLNAQNETETVPFCDKVEVVDKDLEKKLQLFEEYDGFEQALVYKEGEDSYILEIIYKPKDIFKVERRPMTKAQLDEFCAKINSPAIDAQILLLDQRGRTEYLISSTISGLGFYAWATPMAMNIENERPFIATYMLIGGGSFFAPFLLTKDQKMTKSMARSYSVGTATGIGHGLLLKSILDNYDRASDSLYWESGYYDRTQRRLLLPVVTGLAESFTMMHLANKYNLSTSNVGMIATGGVWGTGWGASIGNLFVQESDQWARENLKVSIPSLLGSGAGMYLGHKVYQKLPSISGGDVLVANAYGVLGGLYAATISDIMLDFNSLNEQKILISSMALTSALGIGYGLFRSSDYNYSTSEGAYIGLSEIAGGLLGIGTAYLIVGELESETTLISASLGATAGIFLVDNFLRNRDMKVQTSIGSFDFTFNPIGLSSVFEDTPLTDAQQLQRARTGQNNIVSMRMTF